MAIPHQVRRGVLAVLLLIAFVLQGTTSVLAGTTGTITGSLVDPQSNQPVAGARVTATSPSQSATTTTDTAGRFSFLSLAPDTYTISVAETSTRDASSTSGVTVQADQTVAVSLTQPTKLKVIGTVTSRAAGALVKPGTTADVYSINAVTQDKASNVGGGGNLNTAWSAIATVPGVFVAPNQTGYIGAGASLSIRGGDYDQIGYELDGIPVNRAFDNYPSGSLSSLGQQELQVYTGATPANSEAEGIAGYINQVIRTGTAPASRNLDLAIGTPTFYNKISFEAGGANPARTFSYYLGAGAYNQNFRYYDNYNGGSLTQNWGQPLNACQNNPSPAAIAAAGYYTTPANAPTCYSPTGGDYTNGGTTQAFALGPYNTTFQSSTDERDTVANFHFGLPRKDGNRDDIQLLFSNNFINSPFYTSSNDQGGLDYLNNIGLTPSYVDGFIFTGAPKGTLLPPGYTGGGAQYNYYPDSPGGRPRGALIAPDRRDAFVNNQSIVKAQYQHNFGTNAFLRVYGYTYYSNWLQNGPQGENFNYLGPVSPDYELSAHTRGVSANFSDQINSQHLISLQGSYTTSSVLRMNNSGIGSTGTAGLLVDSSNPYSGTCYTATATPVNCLTAGGPQVFTLRQAFNNTVTPASTFGTCGGGPCQYALVANGFSATYNQVVPKFTSLSITDQWKPTDRLNINLGLRYDRFEFNGSNTFDSNARTLYTNAYNLLHPATPLVNPGAGQILSYDELQPRFGFTYTLNPSTVVRASYGRYAQAPNSAFEQYNFLQSNDTAQLARFGTFGLETTPGHHVRPEVSNNYDFSLEHQFKGDTSIKFTPFLRKTQDQIQQFFLDQKTNFVSGLNVGKQTSEGFELEVDKGDFSRNGLAARLSFTYTNSYINYTKLGNGSSIIDGFNNNIRYYNAFTAFCANNPGDARCGKVLDASGNPIATSPCYTTTHNADTACGPGSIANPYYNAPVQGLMDPNGNYATFDTFPGGIGAGGYESFGAPYVSTLIVQYKHGPLAVTPALQFLGGSRYGVPLSTPGVDPTTCGGGFARLAQWRPAVSLRRARRFSV